MQPFLPATRLAAGGLLLLVLHLPLCLCAPQLVVHGALAAAPARPSSYSSSSPADVISLPSPTVRVLVCGDSITQGQEGDFTWRYRLWEWFRSNEEALARLQQQQQQQQQPTATPNPESDVDPVLLNNDDNNNNNNNNKSPSPPAAPPRGSPPRTTHLAPHLQFVGPYNGTLPASVGPAGVDLQHPQSWGKYHPTVDPAFSPGAAGGGGGGGSAHFAMYGRPAWMVVDEARALVAAHAPDVVVLHLGFNDFGWWSRAPRELAQDVRQLVWNARLARPGARVLVADVGHRLRVPGREDIPLKTEEYNRLLGEEVLEWTTPESPVVLVRVSEEYACHVDSCPAGIDGLHPNALGDFQIARAYTKVLHERFGLGSGPLAVPPLEDIPGMKSIGSFRINPMNVLMYPPVGVFMVVSFLSLIFVMSLRPRWMRVRRTAEKKYQRLLLTRDGMEGL